MPSFWEYPRHHMITHTIDDSYQRSQAMTRQGGVGVGVSLGYIPVYHVIHAKSLVIWKIVKSHL